MNTSLSEDHTATVEKSAHTWVGGFTVINPVGGGKSTVLATTRLVIVESQAHRQNNWDMG
jgi:hypothetical protein